MGGQMLHDVQSMLMMVEVSVHEYDHNSCREHSLYFYTSV